MKTFEPVLEVLCLANVIIVIVDIITSSQAPHPTTMSHIAAWQEGLAPE